MTAQMDNRKISLAVTSYQEFEKTIDSFAQVINDERISEIVLCDDNSDELLQWKLEDWLQFDAPDKIKLCSNIMHIGTYLNTRMAILMADNNFILYYDSQDNIITPEYIDKIFKEENWDEKLMIEIGSGFFVNRAEYIRTFDENDEVFWVKAGNKIRILK